MTIQHIGHSEFLIETESGIRIITDPYGEGCGYPVKRLIADIALVSHGHHDHNATGNLEGVITVIDSAGTFSPAAGIHVKAFEGFHDDAEGNKRGKTLLFLIETEGLRIVHLGDLGCMLNEEQIHQLAQPDVLMIPVGGFYTIDGKTARKVAGKLQPTVTLPMHYKTAYNADWPISGPESFLEGIPEGKIRRNIEVLRITAKDLDCQPAIALFKA